ncbi:MAG TPA: AMP-dependent synthetase/ligase [Ramlibacter sp.]|nr:AMP-dependent synthetase/ligase [Ramlibacter sp.]
MNLWEATRTRSRAAEHLPGDSLPATFWEGVRRRGAATCMRQKELGLWRSWSWEEVGRIVAEAAGGLMHLGLAPRDVAAVLSNTRAEWVWADQAILSCGGVVNGIYPTDAASQVHYLCEDSGTRIVFVEDEEQLDKVLEVRGQLPRLEMAVVFDMKGLRELRDERVISFERLRELGREYNRAHPDELQRRLQAIDPAQVALLVYTSGTTGKPKGAMHSHEGVLYQLRYYPEIIPVEPEGRAERMCFLPLCHIAERVFGEYVPLYAGAVINFVENPETVPENVREIQPTVFFAVPRVWEKFYSGVMIGLREASRLQQATYAWAIGVGGRVADHVLAGRPVPALLQLQFRLARLLALDNVRKLVGIHHARLLLTGAAPIAPDLIRWYLSLGVPMLEAWGMTETCGASTCVPIERIKPGTIGPAGPQNQMRIDPATGELQVKGRNVFLGYLNQPEKTRETFTEDGWLRTGDVGTVDEDGFYRITDRMKDIIITAGGKNITPSEIENELKFSPYITDAVVIGDQRPYLTVIIMIDQENVEKYAQDHDVPFSNYASLTRAPEVQDLIQREVDRVNAKFARVEQAKKFFLLDTQLTAEDEELTPTMKLKRALVQKKYADRIEAMYR